MDLKHLSKLLSLISLPDEAILEKWARLFRFQSVSTHVLEYITGTDKSVRIVDFGCGQDVLFKKYIDYVYPQFSNRITYIGIDPLIQAHSHPLIEHVDIIRSRFEDAKLYKKADIVVMLAVLEHVENAKDLLQSAVHMLKPKGIIVGTTPSPLAKYPLEFLSYQLGVISRREIEEHKRYPTKESIERAVFLVQKRTKKKLHLVHRYFELGLNNLFVVKLDE